LKQLFLEDLKDLSEIEIKRHIAHGYSGCRSDLDYEIPSDEDKAKVENYLSDYNILIAYESVGDFGCDSSLYFLMQHKTILEYEEISGSHCSCFGFEGQFDPEETSLQYLKSDRFYFTCGGYDDNELENKLKVKSFISEL